MPRSAITHLRKKSNTVIWPHASHLFVSYLSQYLIALYKSHINGPGVESKPKPAAKTWPLSAWAIFLPPWKRSQLKNYWVLDFVPRTECRILRKLDLMSPLGDVRGRRHRIWWPSYKPRHNGYLGTWHPDESGDVTGNVQYDVVAKHTRNGTVVQWEVTVFCTALKNQASNTRVWELMKLKEGSTASFNSRVIAEPYDLFMLSCWFLRVGHLIDDKGDPEGRDI